MSDWISETYRSSVGWEHAEQLVDIGHRMGGSENEREGAERTKEAFKAMNARNARLESFTIQGWNRRDSGLTVGDDVYDCIALPYSPSVTATGELVDLGYGLPANFTAQELDGTVVMVSSDTPPTHQPPVHRLEKYMAAVEAGAAAFLFRNHVDGCFPRSGTVGGRNGPLGEIPAVGLSYEEGKRISRQHEGDDVTVTVDATTQETTSHNVHAELGPDTDARVIVAAHVDSHDVSEGAGDDAVGVGMVVELARILEERSEKLGTRVQLSAFGAEELGFLGSAHHVHATDKSSVKAIVQHDGVVRERNLKLFTNGFDGLEGVARGVAARYPDPVSVTDELALASDHWRFVQRGIPGLLAASEPPGGGNAFGSSSGYVTSPADTFDKLDVRDFREQVMLMADVVVELTQPDVELAHRSVDDIETQLDREGKTRLATGFDEWFDPV